MVLESLAQLTSLQGSDVSLEALLDAREKRAFRQRAFLKKYASPLLSLTLVAPGKVKRSPLWDYVFKRALAEIDKLFKKLNISPLATEITQSNAGNEAIFALDFPFLALKKHLVALEESSPLGRLWDLDVLTPEGSIVSRKELGFPPRQCLLCPEMAKICARSRTHSLKEIDQHCQQLVAQDFWMESLAKASQEALWAEASLSPKPGLVDSLDSGAHRDMDITHFYASSHALMPYFRQFAQAGMKTAPLPLNEVLAKIRPIGISAEKAMLQATGGINTHKGAIFHFGLCCTALGRLGAVPYFWQKPALFRWDNLIQQVKAMTAGICQELQDYPENLPLTAGVKLFRQYGITGARGEASAGFPLITAHWRVFSENAQLTLPHQHLLFLLHLMAENQDTNILHRGGMAGLTFVQNYAHKLLADRRNFQDFAYFKAQLQVFNEAMIARHLSGGGSADLLALASFYQLLFPTPFN